MSINNLKMSWKPQNKGIDFGRITFDIFIYLLVVYFVYHALHGDRGFFAYQKLSKEFIEQQNILANLENEKLVYEKKLKLINHQQVDLDLLDELARAKLGLVKPNETMVILK